MEKVTEYCDDFGTNFRTPISKTDVLMFVLKLATNNRNNRLGKIILPPISKIRMQSDFVSENKSKVSNVK